MADCRFGEDVVARALGELEPARAAQVERHLGACARCRALAADLERMRASLGDGDGPARGRGTRPRRVARLGLAAAAIVGIVAWSGVWNGTWDGPWGATGPAIGESVGPPDGGSLAPERVAAADWLVEHLAADGTWASRGPALEDVSLHALGLLALATVEAEAPDPDRREALRSGASWLVGRQHGDGSFGVVAAASTFAQPLATLALVESWSATGEPTLRGPAERGLAQLRERLDAWTRTRVDVPGPTAWAAWGLQALERGHALGLLADPSPPTFALRELPAPAITTDAGDAAVRPDAARAVALGLGRRTHPQLADPVYEATVEILGDREDGAGRE